jgi:hypothetical protein
VVLVDVEADGSIDCGGRDVPGEMVLDCCVAVELRPLTGVGDESPKYVHWVGKGVSLDGRSGQRDSAGVVPGVLLPGVVSKAERGNYDVLWRPVGEARNKRSGIVRFATVVLIEERPDVCSIRAWLFQRCERTNV